MKKMSNSVKCLVAFFAMATAFCVTGVDANAAPVTVQQTKAGDTSFDISWSSVQGATNYCYVVSTDSSFSNVIYSSESKNTSENVGSISAGLIAGSTYYVSVGYTTSKEYYNIPDVKTYDDLKKYYTEPSAPLEVVTAPAEPTAVKFVGADDTTATLAYDACAGATGYDIEYNNGIVGTTTDTTYRLPVIDGAGTLVRVYPYRTSSTGFKAIGSYKACFDFSKLTTTISKDNFGIVDALTNINVFYFAAVGYGSGVDLEAVPVNGKGNAFTITGSLNSKYSLRSDNQVTKGTMYKYRVRAYVTTTDNQKVYGNWSDYRYFINTKDSKYVSSGKKIKLKWGKLKGVTKVKVQIATSENGSYKTCKVLSSKKRAYNITKCGKKPLKRGKKYWVKITYQTKGGTSDVYGVASGVTVR